jgi:CheY-like chemotaxis protein
MPKTLLLADDSVTIQKVVGISLANEDIELVTVENGDDAVTRAQQVRPDIVLADIVMPGRNGYEVCRAIKGDPKLAHVPVLLLTGTFEAFDTERARQVGADGHITKPFEAQSLVDQVNQLLARSTPLPRLQAAPPAPTPAPQAVAPAPAAASENTFDFDESGETSWPTHAAQADAGSSLGEGTPFAGARADAARPERARGMAEQTVLLDTTHASADPDFDAAVEAAAFDAPGVRGQDLPTGDDSGFDLETADLSLSEGASRTGTAPMTFSDPTHPSPGPRAAAPAARSWDSGGDPLLGFDPGESDRTVLDASMVQSFDVPADDLTGPPAARAEDTRPIVEDRNPVRVQSPIGIAPATSVQVESSAEPRLSPALQQHVQATLEKVAWEAFGDLSERVVKEALARIEAVAWEVIPQMAEVLIREEIERMKGADEG